MIKNKILNIKFIFKTYLKILKIGEKNFISQTDFYFIKYKKLIFKNHYQKLFFKTN